MRRSPNIVLAVSLALVSACDSRPRAGRSTAPAVPSAHIAAIVPTPERPMAERREVQELLDSAAALLSAGDTSRALVLLHRSAAFLLVQANAPSTGATDHLLESADALDRYAGRVARGQGASVSELRRLSAMLNLAEAERHACLASVAWSTCSKESIADELLMAADHVERAARDGKLVLPPATLQTLAELRRVATQLGTQRGLDVRTVDEPMGDLQREIDAMRRTPLRRPSF